MFPELQSRCNRKLQSWIKEANSDGAISVEQLLAEGRIHTKLAEIVREREISLIVMGTHGSGGFERFLLGSVTEKMLKLLPCPIWLMKPQAKQ